MSFTLLVGDSLMDESLSFYTFWSAPFLSKIIVALEIR